MLRGRLASPAREIADSLWASQSLTTPPGSAVARAEIVSMEAERVASKVFEDLSFD